MSEGSGSVLFIGGSLDGQRLWVAKLGQPFRAVHPDEPEEVYEMARLAGSSRTFSVYAIQGWNGDDIMERLINPS